MGKSDAAGLESGRYGLEKSGEKLEAKGHGRRLKILI